MDLQVNICKCNLGHVHIILRGPGEGVMAFNDMETFVNFVEYCQNFIMDKDDNTTEIPKAFLDAFRERKEG